jgi:hypothetical protein
MADFTIWLRSRTISLSQPLRVVAALEVVARPPGHHLALAVDQFLVDVDLAVAGVGRARVALLMAAHAHHAGAAPSNVVRGVHKVDQGRLDEIVVVAPDDALLVGMAGTRRMTRCLRLVGPVRRLPQLLHRNAGDLAALLQAHAVGRDGGVEAVGLLGDEVAVDPALLHYVRKEAVEQRDVCARLDVQMQDVVLAGDLLGDVHGHGSARIDEDRLARGDRLPGEALPLLLHRVALQVGHPVREEVVRLRFVRISPD